jgi:DNA-binding transcriptional ArsR family regulator
MKPNKTPPARPVVALTAVAAGDVADPVTDVFSALADPNRRAIYEQLLGGAAMSATMLADGATISRQAIVKHLQQLESADLATSERRGREVVYLPAASGINNLTSWLELTTTRWQRRATKLKAQTTRQ